jgi:hypothetical protein
MINVPRDQMPQIHETDLPRLLVYLGRLGVKLEAGEILVSKLQHYQDINWEVVKAIASDAFKLRKPVLICADDAIIDGNHRAAAHKIAGRDFIGFIRLGIDFEHAIPLLNSFPTAYNKRIATEKVELHEDDKRWDVV